MKLEITKGFKKGRWLQKGATERKENSWRNIGGEGRGGVRGKRRGNKNSTYKNALRKPIIWSTKKLKKVKSL